MVKERNQALRNSLVVKMILLFAMVLLFAACTTLAYEKPPGSEEVVSQVPKPEPRPEPQAKILDIERKSATSAPPRFSGDWLADISTIKDRSKNIVPVFYGTDRKGFGPKDNRSYTGERGEFEYGIAQVSIPKSHNPGELERPLRILTFEFFNENTEDHIVIIGKPKVVRKRYFIELLRRNVEANPRDGVFVFIHGYNVSFNEAIRRTGQLAYDLNFEGPAITYSWPSKSKVDDYLTDSEQIHLSKKYMKKFLVDIKKHSGASRISVVAHSMGNRAFTRVFSDMVNESGLASPVFDQVVLAAPDIDAQIFKEEIAPAIKGGANQITLYTSNNDNVLELSSKLRSKRPRAGQSGKDIVVVDGINTIDASSTNDGFFSFLKKGHSYYGEDLITDLHQIIKNRIEPKNRLLKPVVAPPGKYWIWK